TATPPLRLSNAARDDSIYLDRVRRRTTDDSRATFRTRWSQIRSSATRVDTTVPAGRVYVIPHPDRIHRLRAPFASDLAVIRLVAGELAARVAGCQVVALVGVARRLIEYSFRLHMICRCSRLASCEQQCNRAHRTAQFAHSARLSKQRATHTHRAN